MQRKDYVRIIHVAATNAKECPVCGTLTYRKYCKECHVKTRKLSRERYEEVLRPFGSTSCSNLDIEGLKKVYSVFKRAGFKPKVSPEEQVERARYKTIKVIESSAENLFGENWEVRVLGFAKKQVGKESLEECSTKELRNIIGWLNRYKKYLELRREEKNEAEAIDSNTDNS